jgi:hypothetical protein
MYNPSGGKIISSDLLSDRKKIIGELFRKSQGECPNKRLSLQDLLKVTVDVVGEGVGD